MFDLEFAKQLADPNFSLSVPEPTKAVIRNLVAEVERLEQEVGTERSNQNAWMEIYRMTTQRNNQLMDAIEADSVVMIAQREEIEHLNSQIEAVKAFHRPVEMYLYAATPKVCATCIELWPCQTAQALDVE